LTTAHGTTAKIAAGVYAASVTGLFAASALYHRITWHPAARRRMQRLDHAMIFILIAGTYTPYAVAPAGSGDCCSSSPCSFLR
jgi:hemolysin III